MFKSSATSAEDAKCSGCPTMSKTDEHVERAKELILKNKRTTSHKVGNFIWVSSDRFERKFEHAFHCHQIHSLHLLTLRLYLNFCLQWNDCHSTPPLVTRLSTVWLLSTPKSQDEIPWHDHYANKTAGHICLVWNNALYKMLWTVAQLLGSLYEVPRRLPWREWHWLESMCRCYKETNSAQKLITPRI